MVNIFLFIIFNVRLTSTFLIVKSFEVSRFKALLGHSFRSTPSAAGSALAKAALAVDLDAGTGSV